jgi:DNA segregation ATPase FtsK/SpoIIIE, S-DNA-T family
MVTRTSPYTYHAHSILHQIGAESIGYAKIIGGGLMILSAAALGLACLSYSAADPSLNTASTEATVHNWLGGPGAVWADLLLQNIGLGIMPLVIILVITGLHLWRRDDIRPGPARWAALTIVAILPRLPRESRPLGFCPNRIWAGQ